MNIIGTLIRLVYALKVLIPLIFLLLIILMIACMILFGFYLGVFVAGSLKLEGIYRYACIAGAILMIIFPYVISILFNLLSRIVFVPDDDEEDEYEYDEQYGEEDEKKDEKKDRNKKRRK